MQYDQEVSCSHCNERIYLWYVALNKRCPVCVRELKVFVTLVHSIAIVGPDAMQSTSFQLPLGLLPEALFQSWRAYPIGHARAA
ncbi:MAG: hypothetical protein UY65_C0009G0005 [Parcubacteria group bacterium GW2011_GWA2_51_12]|nr:MAG: hypothetical protein UY65_C0009G0005 [Parcubacteria group bacterium GW2011_GWA2_51_12]